MGLCRDCEVTMCDNHEDIRVDSWNISNFNPMEDLLSYPLHQILFSFNGDGEWNKQGKHPNGCAYMLVKRVDKQKSPLLIFFRVIHIQRRTSTPSQDVTQYTSQDHVK